MLIHLHKEKLELLITGCVSTPQMKQQQPKLQSRETRRCRFSHFARMQHHEEMMQVKSFRALHAEEDDFSVSITMLQLAGVTPQTNTLAGWKAGREPWSAHA